MALFTPEELEELRRADAELDEDFRETSEEVAESVKRDREIKQTRKGKKQLSEEALEARRAKARERYRQDPQKYIERNRRWRKANWDKYLERQREYDKIHRAEMAERQRKYYQQHREEILKRQREYYYANKEKSLAYRKKYRNKQKERRMADAQNSAVCG